MISERPDLAGAVVGLAMHLVTELLDPAKDGGRSLLKPTGTTESQCDGGHLASLKPCWISRVDET